MLVESQLALSTKTTTPIGVNIKNNDYSYTHAGISNKIHTQYIRTPYKFERQGAVGAGCSSLDMKGEDLRRFRLYRLSDQASG